MHSASGASRLWLFVFLSREVSQFQVLAFVHVHGLPPQKAPMLVNRYKILDLRRPLAGQPRQGFGFYGTEMPGAYPDVLKNPLNLKPFSTKCQPRVIRMPKYQEQLLLVPSLGNWTKAETRLLPPRKLYSSSLFFTGGTAVACVSACRLCKNCIGSGHPTAI